MDPKPLRLYAGEDSPRLRYIAGIILGDILGLSWEFTTDRRKLRSHYVINYSSCDINDSFRLVPDTLLFETGIRSRKINVSTRNGLPVFFDTKEGSDFPFDIFAASFWLVSRYEEYLEHDPDEHGRFRASSSVAFRNGFLCKPVVDLWARELSIALLRKFRTIAFRGKEFKAILTIDADQPFAYLGRNLLRSIGGIINDIKESHDVTRRYNAVTRKKRDPFDTFDYIKDKIEYYHSDVRFFFPVGNFSKYDKNPSWKNAEYRNLILKTAEKHDIGLHPSYKAGTDPVSLKSEYRRLVNITGRAVERSRFHFIKLSMPLSYRSVLEAGISEDYSMGYPEEPGFRAGIARPFFYYDIPEEKRTMLKVYPFQVMDGTFYQYKGMDAVASKKVIEDLVTATRMAGGTFISIWHNTSLLDDDKWKEWRSVFEFMLSIQYDDSLS
jgi:hypothetical protein